MYTGIYFLVQAIFYMLLLLVVFFNKKRIHNVENKIYSLIIVIATFELLLELSLHYFVPLNNKLGTVSTFFEKLYCVSIQGWITCLCSYIVNLSLKMKNYSKYNKLINNVFIAIFLIFSLLIFIFKIDYYYNGNVIYTFGSSVNIVYVASFLFSFIGIGCLIWNIDNIKDKRFFPLLFFLFLGGIGTYIQYKNPGLLLAVPLHAFITFLMYFTIENPDIHVVEEMGDLHGMISKANESKTLFIYNIAENLRFPLMNINKIVNVSRDEEDKIILKSYLNEITEETSKLDFYINDAMNMSNIKADKIRTYSKEYDLQKILKEIKLRYYDMVNDNVMFRLNISEDMPTVFYGDELRLKQVLFSLLNHAINGTKEGYIEFDLGYVIKQDVCRLFITIEDTEEYIEEKNEIIDDIENTNLSLKGIEYVTEQIGGTIMIDHPKKGLKIMVVLDQVLAHKEANSIYRKMVDLRKNIIYVGINYEEISHKYNRYFGSENIKVDYNQYGLYILDRIRKKESFDLIIINDNLERMSGLETVKKILKEEKYSGKVVVIGPTSKKDDYQKLGIYNYLENDIDDKELIMNILKILR